MKRTDVAERMNRTWEAVAHRARQLRLTKEIVYTAEPRSWTAREDERLRAMKGTMTKPEIARRLKRSTASVAGRIAVLRLGKPRTVEHRPWTPKENAYLKKSIGAKSRQEMAEYLGRTYVAVTAQLRKLGLGEEKRYAIEPRPWTKADDRQLRTLARSIRSHDEIAKRMGRTHNAIGARKKKLGLTHARAGNA
jgi:hypothetical protein